MAAVLPDVPALHPLRELVEDDFSLDAVEAAARAHADRENPLRLNFFCAAMRILFEHSMERLSPPDQIELCAWFRPEQQSGKPTRAQRVKYAVQGGLSDAFVAERLAIDLRPVQLTFTRTIDNLSKHIHAREHTVVRNIAEQDALAQEVIDAAVAYFKVASEARVAVMAPIQEQLDETAVDALLQETILAIDELASHHSIEEVYVDRVVVYRIDAQSIVYRAHGTISVGLQWGSNSDVRRGDGAELDEDFPFECDITVPLEDPWGLDRSETEYRIDTSEWTDAMQPDCEDDWGHDERS